MTMLNVALDAAARGWHVFPLRPGDKRPALHGEQRCPRSGGCASGHQGWERRATTDPDRIRTAWKTAPFNVGIATGPSGLVVVDLDRPKPGTEAPPEWRMPGVVDGTDVFTTLCPASDRLPEALATYTVRTGRGGTHLYYRHADAGPALRNTAGSLGWLVDTRAHGGYVVAAGSTVNGNRYTTTHDAEPASLPDWLGVLLRPAPLPPQQPVHIDLATDRHGAYLRAALAGQIERVTNAPEGGRNRALYLSAVALGQLVAGGALAENDVTRLLTQAALSTGLQPAETARTIASGLRAGAARPRSVAA